MMNFWRGSLPEFDERREIARLLRATTIPRRLAWLKWCCEKASRPGSTTYIQKADGSVNQVWSDAMSLVLAGLLSLIEAGEKLVQIVRGR
jgi:hypothetical protein